MSSDPLSRDVSTPSASSIESVPEVASQHMDRKAAEPEREVVSTSRCQVNDKEDEVAISCGNLISHVTPEECTTIVRMYSLYVTKPTDLEKAHTPPSVI